MLDDPRRAVTLQGERRPVDRRPEPIGVNRHVAGVLSYVATMEEEYRDVSDRLAAAQNHLATTMQERDELAQRVFNAETVIAVVADEMFRVDLEPAVLVSGSDLLNYAKALAPDYRDHLVAEQARLSQ